MKVKCNILKMKTIRNFFLLAVVSAVFFSCFRTSQAPVVLTQDSFPAPPVATIKPDTFREFGNIRIDNYFWLKEKSNPEVLNYLQA